MKIPALLTALLLAALAACGTTEPAAAPPAPDAPQVAPVTLTDLRGKQITLPGPATRVVGLEWNVAEHAVSLGVMPVGVADVAGYGKWVKAEPLGDVRQQRALGERPDRHLAALDVAVGEREALPGPRRERRLARFQLRVERREQHGGLRLLAGGRRDQLQVAAHLAEVVLRVAALRPDLVLATDELPDTAVAQMERFAPVVFVAGGDAKDNLGQMRRKLELLATATGKQAEASALLTAFDVKLEAGKAALAARAGQRFAFADGYVEGSQVSIRPYAKGSLLSAVTERLGMANAWTEPGDPVYGLGQTDVEGLTRLGDATFLYIANDGDGGDPFTAVLGGNAVWRSLPFVQEREVHRLPDGIWMFGGPTSMTQYVDAVVAALGR